MSVPLPGAASSSLCCCVSCCTLGNPVSLFLPALFPDYVRDMGEEGGQSGPNTAYIIWASSSWYFPIFYTLCPSGRGPRSAVGLGDLGEGVQRLGEV